MGCEAHYSSQRVYNVPAPSGLVPFSRWRCCRVSLSYRPFKPAPKTQRGVKGGTGTLNQAHLRRTWPRELGRNRFDWEVHAEASASLPDSEATDGEGKGEAATTLRWLGISILVLAALVGGVYASGHGPTLQDWAQNSPLGKSGFLAAFALIFLSEIGDKTFFIAGLLAMKVGKLCSFAGASLALAAMTVISVGIGYAFKSVPDALKSSIPIGEILGVGLMVYFGIRTLKAAWDLPPEEDKGEAELEAAKSTVSDYEMGGKMKPSTFFASLLEVATLIFVAEWGDRSMLATVALGAAQSPIGVASGAILGHVIATAIAVIGGSIASQYISEKMIGYIGGTLFLFFAAATHFGIF